MKDVVVVNIGDSIQKLEKNCLYFKGLEPVRIVLDNAEKVFSIDEIQRHVCCAPVLENLMDPDDIRVIEFGQSQGFLAKLADDLPKTGLKGIRPHLHGLAAATADRIRKTLLDHDLPFKAVGRKIGDAEPTGAEILFNPVLPVQQLIARPQRIIGRVPGSGFIRIRRRVHSWIGRVIIPVENPGLAGFRSGARLRHRVWFVL